MHQGGIAERREFKVLEEGPRRALVLATAPALGRPRPKRREEARGLNVYEAEPASLTVRTYAWDGQALLEWVAEPSHVRRVRICGPWNPRSPSSNGVSQRSTISSGRNSSSSGTPRSGCLLPVRARVVRISRRSRPSSTTARSTTVSASCSTTSSRTPQTSPTRPTTRASYARPPTPGEETADSHRLAAEIAGAQVESYQAWVKAREECGFEAFRPSLDGSRAATAADRVLRSL